VNRYWLTIGVQPDHPDYWLEVSARLLVFVVPIIVSIMPHFEKFPARDFILMGIPSGIFSVFVVLVLYIANVLGNDVRYKYAIANIAICISSFIIILSTIKL